MRVGKCLAMAMATGLVACGSFPTTHPDATKNNPATYKIDLKDCVESYPDTPDGIYLKQRISCMKLKGWK